MLNKTLIVAGASALLAASADAAIVTRWNFNGASMGASSGTGSAMAIGGTTVLYTAGSEFDTAPGTNRSARVANFSPLAAHSGSRGMQFSADTRNFGFLGIGFAIAGHGRSSQWGQLQYSLNGGATYLTAGLAGSGRFRVNGDGTFKRIGFSLAFIDGASDKANFRFRIVAVAHPTSGSFIGANGAGMLASAFWKIDSVTVTGTSLGTNNTASPAPGAIALLGAAGLVGATRRRA